MSVRTHLETLARELKVDPHEQKKIEISYAAVDERLRIHFGVEVRAVQQFGSSMRGTMLPRRADPASDVDVLIVFRNEYSAKPQALFDRLRRFSEKYYPQSLVSQSAPTVVLELNHIKFDLVPAMGRGLSRDHMVIPAPRNAFRTWIGTDPGVLARGVDQAHREHNKLIRPIIRLLKYWNAQHGKPFESYFLERQVAGFWFLGADEKLRSYFYRAVGSLDGSRLSRRREVELDRFQAEVRRIHRLDNVGDRSAEARLQRVLPLL